MYDFFTCFHGYEFTYSIFLFDFFLNKQISRILQWPYPIPRVEFE